MQCLVPEPGLQPQIHISESARVLSTGLPGNSPGSWHLKFFCCLLIHSPHFQVFFVIITCLLQSLPLSNLKSGNLIIDSIFKSRDITLPTKVRLVKAMVFPMVMYGYESWTVKEAER